MSATPSPDVVGLLGLGLMGRGIAASLVSHGLTVVGFNRTPERGRQARAFVGETLEELVCRGLRTRDDIADWETRFRLVDTLEGLADSPFVIESVKEDLELKRGFYRTLEDCLSSTAVIASNTSSFPLTLLQQESARPERFLVMHWSEPAWITRFLEIVRNEQTSPAAVAAAEELGRRCEKQPSVLNFDIRGFVANRLMYAFIREACHLVDAGVADPATIDRSFRNDVGWWATLAGPFRWMDLTGIEAYGLVMEELLPELCVSPDVPEIMKRMRRERAEGVRNLTGFYPYTEATAKAWEQAWVDFTYDLRELILKYEARLQEAGALEED